MAKVTGNKHSPGNETHQTGKFPAKADRFAKNTGAGMSKTDNAKLGDIYTAAKSTMAAESYETGYPANANELTNARPEIRKGKTRL